MIIFCFYTFTVCIRGNGEKRAFEVLATLFLVNLNLGLKFMRLNEISFMMKDLETSENLYQIVRRYNTEDNYIQTRCRENLI